MSKRDKKHKDTTSKPRPLKDEILMSTLKRPESIQFHLKTWLNLWQSRDN